MKEPQLIIGAAVFIVALAIAVVLDWRKKHPASERGDPYAAYDRRPSRPVGSLPRATHAPVFTDSMGRPRLPTAAEITSELQAIGSDSPETRVYPRPKPPVVTPPPVLEPTEVYEPRRLGPEPGEWSFWAGRWWAPTALEDRLPGRDWLPGHEDEPDWLLTLLAAA